MKEYNDSFIRLQDNRKLSFLSYGDTNENTVIFFHGFGSSASSIHPDTKILDKYNVRFFAINRPGYGESDVKIKYSMEDFADSINELLIAKGIEKASIIGWSAGGLYSQVFTGKYSEKVTSLNLISSAIPLNSNQTTKILPANWKSIVNMNKYIPLMTKLYFKSLSKKITNNLDSTIHKSIQQMVEEDKKVAVDPIMMSVIIKGAVESYHNKGIGVYYDALALCQKFDDKRSPFLNVKVNIWQGGKDTIWTSETSNYLREKYSNSTYSFIDNEGHLLYLSHWDEILKKSFKTP
ncbi:alpha/beta hydrolase [Bacillus sp. UNC438CL73TsuS30]|uniref:alpha/beta hydrolase n=1 Tax=Bacillus sp. UNC438CL73TsuS30 TaxID=1340434 RepID=UPI00047BE8B5|nr:alpha/beta hydrolase [Bacillus sp. UNC438CL73TsuS30]